MRIYEMTATFGKLEHETLTLKPGLNIIEAPNEWGKSTWCAFLAAMLYGLDTRAKTTKTALADKERYAPWSGAPMSGRVDLRWNGRDITIERRTKGRIPMGDFRAYETATGIPVPELTAANCGQTLLGVEQTVFRRAGFIRLAHMPVTQDEALRSRLNALVTTGDESADAERLGKQLRELRNHCRYNRTGLIPQAEAELKSAQGKLREVEELESHSQRLHGRLSELEEQQKKLENHRTALACAAAREDARRVAQARSQWEEALHRLDSARAACAGIPDREEAQRQLDEIRALREQWASLQDDASLLAPPPQPPEPEPAFRELTGEEAADMAWQDGERYRSLNTAKPLLPMCACGAILLAAAVIMLILSDYLVGTVALGAAILSFGIAFAMRLSRKKQAKAIAEKYGALTPEQWMAAARRYGENLRAHDRAQAEYRASRGNLDSRVETLRISRRALCGEMTMQEAQDYWQRTADAWAAQDAAQRDALRAEEHWRGLQAMSKPVPQPEQKDALTYSESQTMQLLADTAAEKQRLLGLAGQYRGRMDALGCRVELEKQRLRAEKRLRRLEDTYAALTIAQETLAEARLELQRRFAPRISSRAQELMARLTGGRYDRLSLGADFSLRAGAGEEDTIREALWRSDGTVDQLYLALRLAVAEELTPDAPLVLDDALVRFDDTRLKAILDILREMAEKKQVILFTCQSREANLL